MKRKAVIGSISSGTMRERDLIPCFLDCIAEFSRSRARRLRKEFEQCPDGDLSEFCNELFDVLNEYAPAYFYFGAHPGDGADYGFWLSEDWEQDLTDDGGIKVNSLGDVPKGFTGHVAQVTDHGNVTLYSCNRGRKTELWAVV